MNAASAAVLAAIIGAGGAIAANVVPEMMKKERVPVAQGVAEGLPAVETQATENKSSSWKLLKSGVVYKAESEGFIVIASGGTNPAKNVDILTGNSPDQMQTRSRMGAVYSGTMLPVSEGEYWLVRIWDNDDGTVDVQWKPR